MCSCAFAILDLYLGKLLRNYFAYLDCTVGRGIFNSWFSVANYLIG